MTLFELEPVPAEPEVKLSADVRRRLRQEELIAAGVHPIGRRRLLIGTSETCGGCRFRQKHQMTYRKDFWKCDQGPITRSVATDVKAKWPACRLFERADA